MCHDSWREALGSLSMLLQDWQRKVVCCTSQQFITRVPSFFIYGADSLQRIPLYFTYRCRPPVIPFGAYSIEIKPSVKKVRLLGRPFEGLCRGAIAKSGLSRGATAAGRG
eukprot:1159220-Pelagomonas_calceolata.AAC.6